MPAPFMRGSRARRLRWPSLSCTVAERRGRRRKEASAGSLTPSLLGENHAAGEGDVDAEVTALAIDPFAA
jgi:hypothetical protein